MTNRVDWKLEISLGHLLTALTMIVAVVGSYTMTVTKMEAQATELERLRTNVLGIQSDAPALEGRLTRIEVGLENLNANVTRLVDTLNRN